MKKSDNKRPKGLASHGPKARSRSRETGAFHRVFDDSSLLAQLHSEVLAPSSSAPLTPSLQDSTHPPSRQLEQVEPRTDESDDNAPTFLKRAHISQVPMAPSSHDAKRQQLPGLGMAPLSSAGPAVAPPSLPGALHHQRSAFALNAAPATNTGLSAGALIAGRYRLESKLGAGNMGSVFLARDMQSGEVYALKILHPWLSDDERSVELFTHEYLRMKRLSHPGIAKTYCLERESQHKIWYLLMEYIDGVSLQEQMQRKMETQSGQPFSLEETLYLFARITPTLRFLHEKRLVHRDLKPSHIMWTSPDSGGDIKLLGLGMTAPLMRSSGSSLHLGQGHASLYTAPERMVPGEPATHATDIFSLGVILYQMLTGALPIGVAAMPSAIHEHIPPQIDGVLRRSLELPWRARYGSIDEMLEELKDAVSAAYRLSSERKQQRTSETTLDMRNGLEQPNARLFPVIKPLEPQEPVSNAQRLSRLRRKLSDRVEQTASLQPADPPQELGRLPIKRANPKRALSFHTSQEDVTALSFSPDGCFLASASSDATIKLWEVPSWYSLHTIELGQARLKHLCWSPLGRCLAYSDGAQVHIRDVMHPERRHLLTLSAPCQALSWHPDGSALLVASADGTIQLWDPESIFMPRTIPSHGEHICAISTPRHSHLPSHHIASSHRALIGGTDGYIALWDLQDDEVICQFSEPGSTLSALTLHPNADAFLSGNTRGEIQLWEPEFHGQTRSWRAHDGPILHMEISHHGEWFVSADQECAQMWRTSDGENIATFEPTSQPLRTVALSPDSRWIVLNDHNDQIKLWDISSWNPRS